MALQPITSQVLAGLIQSFNAGSALAGGSLKL
jgi:hypothetical protein